MSNSVVGFWTDELESGLLWRDLKTSYVNNPAFHEGPVFKFPTGRPKVGDPVVCHVAADAMRNRGALHTRPVLRYVVRVKISEEPPRYGGNIVLETEGDRGFYLGPRHAPTWIANSEWERRTDESLAVRTPILPPMAGPSESIYDPLETPEYSNPMFDEHGRVVSV